MKTWELRVKRVKLMSVEEEESEEMTKIVDEEHVEKIMVRDLKGGENKDQWRAEE